MRRVRRWRRRPGRGRRGRAAGCWVVGGQWRDGESPRRSNRGTCGDRGDERRAYGRAVQGRGGRRHGGNGLGKGSRRHTEAEGRTRDVGHRRGLCLEREPHERRAKTLRDSSVGSQGGDDASLLVGEGAARRAAHDVLVEGLEHGHGKRAVDVGAHVPAEMGRHWAPAATRRPGSRSPERDGRGSATSGAPGARCARASRSWARPRWMRERTVPSLTPSVALISS